MRLFKLIMFLSALLTVLGLAATARADTYLKCTAQVVNPYKGTLMSSGEETIYLHQEGDKLVKVTKVEALMSGIKALSKK